MKAEGENYIFFKTLLDITIQDSGIRERKGMTSKLVLRHGKCLK